MIFKAVYHSPRWFSTPFFCVWPVLVQSLLSYSPGTLAGLGGQSPPPPKLNLSFDVYALKFLVVCYFPPWPSPIVFFAYVGAAMMTISYMPVSHAVIHFY
jgi:hypothetical protein